jgi:GntR family transcriptional regulator, trigonelline degradation regulator
VERRDMTIQEPKPTIQRVDAPLRQQVIEHMRRAVVTSEFKPGDRLVEKDLTERWQVSRTVIREALRQLEAEGLVTIVANRGPVVATLSRDDAAALYEVRAVLESMAAKLFVQRAEGSQVHALRVALQGVRSAFDADDPAGWLEAKDEFYSVLFVGAGNPVVQSMLKTVQARIQYLRGLSLSLAGRKRESIDELQRALVAIEARDSAAAGLAIEIHVQRAADAALAEFDAIAAVESTA